VSIDFFGKLLFFFGPLKKFIFICNFIDLVSQSFFFTVSNFFPSLYPNLSSPLFATPHSDRVVRSFEIVVPLSMDYEFFLSLFEIAINTFQLFLSVLYTAALSSPIYMAFFPFAAHILRQIRRVQAFSFF